MTIQFSVGEVEAKTTYKCSLSRSHPHENDFDRLKPQTMQLPDYGPSSASVRSLMLAPLPGTNFQ